MANQNREIEIGIDRISGDDSWVEDRLAELSVKSGWTPNAGRSLAYLHARSLAKTRGIAARRWVWTTVAAAGAVGALFLFPASRACAQQPAACVLHVLGMGPMPGAPGQEQCLVAEACTHGSRVGDERADCRQIQDRQPCINR